jgi:TonB family protein
VEELQEFFATHHLPFGSPEDIVPFAESLSAPGLFQDEMASMMRSIVLREGGNVPRAELLQLVSTAVGGPHFEESSQEHLQPVLKILSFLADVHRSRWGIVPEERGDAEAVSGLPEPGSAQAYVEPAALAGAEIAASAMPVSPFAARADSLTEAAAPERSAPDIYSRSAATYPERERPDAIGNLRAFPAPMAAPRFAETEAMAGEKVAPRPWMQRRAVWAVAACGVLLAVVGGAVLHRRAAEQTEWAMEHVRPVPAAVSPDVSGPVKPTAYGPSIRSARSAGGQRTASAAGRTQGAAPYDRGGRRKAGDGVSVESANQAATVGQQSWAAGGSQSGVRQDPAQAPIYRVSPATDWGSHESPVETVSPAEPGSAVRRTQPASRLVPAASFPSAGRSFGRRTLSVSSGVMAGNVISAPAPAYPKVAKFAHIQGQVILQAVVSRNGNVVATHVLRGHRLLRGAAKDAVSRWRFRPYIFNGRPTDVATIVTVDFRRSH